MEHHAVSIGAPVSSSTKLRIRRSHGVLPFDMTGKPFRVQMGRISGKRVRAAWFDPRTGQTQPIGIFANRGRRLFTPPGKPKPGNDWALLLNDAAGATAR